MTRRSVLVALTYAGGAFALGLAGLLPLPLGAADPLDQLKAEVAAPTLSVDGGLLSMRRGDDGAMELVARNPTNKNVSVTCTVQVQTTAPASPMARVMPRPKTHWQKEMLISLSPDETRVMALDMPALPGDASVRALLISGDRRVVAFSSNAGNQLVNGVDLGRINRNIPSQR